MTDENSQKRLMDAIAGADDLWQENGSVIANQADSWLRKNGVINQAVINNTMMMLLSSIDGLKDLMITADQNRMHISFYFALSRWIYFFKRHVILREWGAILSHYFPTFEIEINICKFKLGWEDEITKEAHKVEEQRRKEELKGLEEAIRAKGTNPTTVPPTNK